MRVRADCGHRGNVDDRAVVLLQRSEQLLREEHRHLEVHAHHLGDPLRTQLLVKPVVRGAGVIDEQC